MWTPGRKEERKVGELERAAENVEIDRNLESCSMWKLPCVLTSWTSAVRRLVSLVFFSYWLPVTLCLCVQERARCCVTSSCRGSWPVHFFGLTCDCSGKGYPQRSSTCKVHIVELSVQMSEETWLRWITGSWQRPVQTVGKKLYLLFLPSSALTFFFQFDFYSNFTQLLQHCFNSCPGLENGIFFCTHLSVWLHGP